MLTVQELLEIKARMLLAAEAAHQIVESESPLELDEQTFVLVNSALLSLRDDARKVLAEVDILRGMVTGSFDTLFKETEHGRSADVEPVQQPEAVGGGSGELPDSAGTGGDVRPSGPDGQEAERPKPSRNRRRRRRDQEGVDAGG